VVFFVYYFILICSDCVIIFVCHFILICSDTVVFFCFSLYHETLQYFHLKKLMMHAQLRLSDHIM
jgi:hypothetical protein